MVGLEGLFRGQILGVFGQLGERSVSLAEYLVVFHTSPAHIALVALVAIVVVCRQLLDEEVVRETAVGVQFGLGRQILVLSLVNHDAGHLGKMYHCRELDDTKVVETADDMLEIPFGNRNVHRVGIAGIHSLQHLRSEKVTT